MAASQSVRSKTPLKCLNAHSPREQVLSQATKAANVLGMPMTLEQIVEETRQLPADVVAELVERILLLDNNMTTDGISTEDWEVVQDYAAKIANAVCADDSVTSDALTEQLLCYLDCMETKYGKLPSIIATRADYTTDLIERVQLLEHAYELAKQLNDRSNMALTASSLAQLFVEETVDVPSAGRWLASLAESLGEKWDDLEHKEFQRLTAELENLKQRRKPDSLA